MYQVIGYLVTVKSTVFLTEILIIRKL